MKTNSIIALSTASAALFATQGVEAKSSKSGQPHIILIYTDDMGIGDLSCYNNGWIQTPNIDALAKEGVTYKHYYSAAPVSSASRVGVTTGMFPVRWGVTTFLSAHSMNQACEQKDCLAAEAPSLARQLKDAGYRTGHFGKWHMGGGRKVQAPAITEFGFDEYVSTYESPDPAPELTSTEWIWADTDSIKRWDRTRYFVDRALEFFEENQDEPCYINLWPDDMHSPWVGDPEAAASKKGWNTQPRFEPVLEEYDRQIGRFLNEIDKMGLSENTIIIFTSDNGPAPSFERKRTCTARGTKNSNYEGGINMPFIVRWPAQIEPNQVDDESVICSVDLFPTLCKIAGADLPSEYELDGEDISKSLVKGRTFKRSKSLMWCFGWTPRFNKPTDEVDRSPHLAIRNGDWKLLTNVDGNNTELYNIVNDPLEEKNIASANPKIAKRLKAEVLDWWTTSHQWEK